MKYVIVRINNSILICQALHVTLRQRKEMMKAHNNRDKKLFLNYCKMEKSIKRNRETCLEEVLEKLLRYR